MRHLPADKVTAKRWLLPGDPFRVEKIAKYLDGPVDLGWSREFKMAEGSFHGIPVGVCSTGIGGPSCEIAANELWVLGATHVVRVGTCGSLRDNIRVGHVVSASMAIGQGKYAYPTLKNFLADHHGPFYSTDHFYGDWPAPPDCIAVEMEAVSLFRAAEKKKIKAGCVCAVSDAKETTRYEAGIDKAIVSALDGITR